MKINFFLVNLCKNKLLCKKYSTKQKNKYRSLKQPFCGIFGISNVIYKLDLEFLYLFQN